MVSRCASAGAVGGVVAVGVSASGVVRRVVRQVKAKAAAGLPVTDPAATSHRPLVVATSPVATTAAPTSTSNAARGRLYMPSVMLIEYVFWMFARLRTSNT